MNLFENPCLVAGKERFRISRQRKQTKTIYSLFLALEIAEQRRLLITSLLFTLSMPCKDRLLLTHTNRDVTNLKEDICGLSAEMLSSYINTAAAQVKKSSAMSATLSDPMLWDPIRSRPSSCSTPNPQAT